jgi:hypothetical protein
MIGLAYTVAGRWVDNVFWCGAGAFAGWHANKKRLAGASWKAIAGEAAVLIVVVVLFYVAMYFLGGNGL